MLTGIFTFAIIVSVVGAILYGKKLVKNEKIDAVFGNPERAKGGVHWVVVGSSVLILSWLYFSWDIAKSFYPKSANELCQVGKVRDSLMSLKYLFPIEERQHKSTAIIQRENVNIRSKIKEVQNHPTLSSSDKQIYLDLLEKTKFVLPSLTNPSLLEEKNRSTIANLTNRIIILAKEFPKDTYPPPLSQEEESKRIEALKKQTGWGTTGEEVPTLPESKSGLKFHTAAIELNEISDVFFEMRNHNPEYLRISEEIETIANEYKDNLGDDQDLELGWIKDILKLNQRIEYASIFPPKALNEMEQAIRDFDVVQNKQQGSLKLIDAVFFPGGTILSSGPTCSEDGPGRWLPKPSDTFRIFADLLKPSVGFKYVPMIGMR